MCCYGQYNRIILNNKPFSFSKSTIETKSDSWTDWLQNSLVANATPESGPICPLVGNIKIYHITIGSYYNTQLYCTTHECEHLLLVIHSECNQKTEAM